MDIRFIDYIDKIGIAEPSEEQKKKMRETWQRIDELCKKRGLQIIIHKHYEREKDKDV